MFSQKIHVYAHRDFDGLVAAAILTKIFSKLKKFDVFDYILVDYNTKNEWLNLNLQKPSVVIDFLFHPEANYYYDHHTTSFINNDIKKIYKKSQDFFWDEKFASTPSILKYIYNEVFDFSKYQDLINWSDIIDSAKYNSPNDLYNYSNTFIILNKLIGYYYNDDKVLKEIIMVLVNDTLEEFLISKKDTIQGIVTKEKAIINKLKNKMLITNKICLFDQSDINIDFQRYLSYYFYPNIDYTIAIYKSNEIYKISLGYNPWKNDNNINLGELASQHGGGGRQNVAGIITKTRNEAIKIVEEIANYLLKLC